MIINRNQEFGPITLNYTKIARNIISLYPLMVSK